MKKGFRINYKAVACFIIMVLCFTNVADLIIRLMISILTDSGLMLTWFGFISIMLCMGIGCECYGYLEERNNR